MSTILNISSSLFGKDGQSSKLARTFISRLLVKQPDAEVIHRDLAAKPVPHLTADSFQGFTLQAAERSESQSQAAELSDQLINELQQADILVLGLPMYNFGIPSTLKAYFDHIARAGITFKYTDQGAVGLLTGKKAYVLTTRGGLYKGTPKDTETRYVTDFLAFLGIDDVQFVYAEGLAISDVRGKALQDAEHAIEHLEV
ncbi:FMN-dependent NADH-azoreductase [Endozoicomonas montiporae]|uniref:FMN dependent NADH:quinone oxidoreductase n=2 Tax=Endozoicomonas montiporae TaxID=1027273 RepID=A0A081N5T1_9GAMM|nr:NAD(P)H-dependent oxidoreductase [Endozoicomonas montiporae]AMO57295.1 FMN-dependent NADH-azoreductase [Endozoicomonas montiporae CL-33]KEQ13804.1 FMN-dependent NADH-azoreductase [Endozoicomonas montiporae]